MKASVKTIVEAIEKEIRFLIDYWDCYENDTERDFLYGSFNFDLNVNRKPKFIIVKIDGKYKIIKNDN